MTPLWTIEIVWKRWKNQPVQEMSTFAGSHGHALLMARDIAKRMKIPKTWVTVRRKEEKG